MKLLKQVVSFGLLFVPFFVCAEPTQRDMAIRHLEEITLTSKFNFSPTSPSTDLLFQSGRAANPGVSVDIWKKVKTDFSAAWNNEIATSNPYAGLYKDAVKNFSDDELVHLSQLYDQMYDDPIFKKFIESLASPQIQQQSIQKFSLMTLMLMRMVNAALSSNGLKPVH